MGALDGRIALVTGSSRGIGAAIARHFARHGAKVAVHGRDRAALGVVQAEIERAGGRALQVIADVTKFAEIEAMRRDIEAELGPVDVLVANAGGSFTMPGPLEETSEEGWRASVDGNLTATFLTLRSFLPGMKQRRRGSIITVSSVAGHRPHPRAPIPYSAAKAGIEMLTKDLAGQTGAFGIRVNCIAPETILTSDESSWITGAVVDVAGGGPDESRPPEGAASSIRRRPRRRARVLRRSAQTMSMSRDSALSRCAPARST